MTRKWKVSLLAVYGLVMVWLLFGQRMGKDNEPMLQMTLFATLERFWRVLMVSTDPDLRRQAWINLAGNVVMFVPMGFFFPWIWNCWRKIYLHFLLMAGIILSVEVTQILTRLGTCDVDDLLLNLVGTGLGFLAWYLLFRKEPQKTES